MLRRFREPYGKAGLIVAVVALVAAAVGGAYAANGLTGQQKKEVKKIAKQFAGKNGQPGSAGQNGAQGPKGDPGAAGTNGNDGDDGKEGEKGKTGESVSIIPLAPGDKNCPSGGAKFTNLTGSAFACNGEGGEGGGGYPDTLPSGHSMTGYWEVLGEAALHAPFVPEEEWALTTISFPLSLAVAPTETVLIPASGGSEEQEEKCPGSTESPEASPGVLCLYQSFGEPMALKFGGATTFGAGLFFAEKDEGFGSWAVEAP